MRSILQAQQATEGRGEFLPVWRCCQEQILRSVVIVSAIQAAETDAADGIGCGYASEDRKAHGYIEVLVAAAFLKH